MNSALPYQERNLFIMSAIFFLLIGVFAFVSGQFLLGVIPFAIVLAFFFLLDIRIAFYVMLFMLPLSFNIESIGLDFPDEPLLLLLTLSFVFFSILNYRSIDFQKWIKHPIVMLVLIGFIWLIISVVFSKDPALSSKFLLKRIWYLSTFLFFPIVFFAQQKTIAYSFYLIFFPLLALICLVLIRFSALGFRFEAVHDPVQPFFMNHVMYGSMISSFLPLIVGALFLTKRFRLFWFFVLGAIAIFMIGIYFSYSRAAWMAVLFAAGMAVCVYFKLAHYAMTVFYIVVLSAVLWLSNKNEYLNFRPKFERTIMHESLTDHIMATIQGTDISSAERYYRWIAAVRMSVDNPIVGVGPNNFYDYYKNYTVTAYKTWVSRNIERSTTHNYFLYMLVEQGYPGMILYGLLILSIFFYGQRIYHKQIESFYKVAVMSAISMIAAIFINNFFSELLETDKIGSLFLLAIAVLVAIDLRSRRMIENEPLV